MDKPAPFFGLFHLLRLAACFIPFLLADAAAQDLPGQRVALQSATLNEQRVVQVLLPEGHKPASGERYDVLYVLDGDGNLRTIADILRFGQAESQLPPIILVAVFNTHRDRDMAPGSVGGAANFLSFFKNELIPHMDKAYPTSGRNLLFGHSLGGLFAMHALLSEPQLFDGYLAIDPSLWWDGGAINKLAAGQLSSLALAEKSLFIAGREGEGLRQMGIVDMDAALKGKAPKGLSWKVAAYPGETHGSIRLKGVYDGLRFFYDGYSSNAVVFHPMNGRVLEGEPYKVYLMGGSNAVRYTTDGSAPTASSPVMPSEITLSNGARISAKVVGRNDRYNKTTVGSFSVANPPAAAARPAGTQPGAWRYAYYEGEWDALPDFAQLKPVKSGLVDKDFDVNKLPRQYNFSCLVEGFIEIQKPGHYVFALDSDDGSKLFVGGELLIDYDGLHGGGNTRSAIVPLAQGFYPVRIEYFQKGGGALLNLRYIAPEGEASRLAPVPFELRYTRR